MLVGVPLVAVPPGVVRLVPVRLGVVVRVGVVVLVVAGPVAGPPVAVPPGAVPLAAAARLVKAVMYLPSGVVMYRLKTVPPRSDANAIYLPSGDQAGTRLVEFPPLIETRCTVKGSSRLMT